MLWEQHAQENVTERVGDDAELTDEEKQRDQKHVGSKEDDVSRLLDEDGVQHPDDGCNEHHDDGL